MVPQLFMVVNVLTLFEYIVPLKHRPNKFRFCHDCYQILTKKLFPEKPERVLQEFVFYPLTAPAIKLSWIFLLRNT